MTLASPVAAATYHVSPSGSDANSGLSASQAWATIGKANATVGPGDVVRVADGAYGHFPNPSRSGTASQRITYVGNLAAPGAVRITGGTNLSRDHVTIKGFELQNGFHLTGNRDSIAYCLVTGNTSKLSGADDCVITDCTFDSDRFWVVGSESDTTIKAERDTIANCYVRLTPDNPYVHTVRFQLLEACVFSRVRYVITVGPAAKGASATKLFFVRNTRFIDCSWDVTNLRTTDPDEAGWFVNRDYTQNNLWARDTIIMRGPGPIQYFGAASGTYVATVMGNRYVDCVFKLDGPLAYGAAVHYQDRARWETWQNCVIVGKGAGMFFQGMDGPTLVENCTIAGFNPYGGAVGFSPHGNANWNGTLTFRNNILYTHPSAATDKHRAPINANYNSVNGHLDANHNVLYSPHHAGNCIYVTAWGQTGPGPGKPWCDDLGAGCQSLFGDPRFASTASVVGFDARLGAGSAAIGAGSGGRDVGAYPFAGDGDSTPPAVITDLAEDEQP